MDIKRLQQLSGISPLFESAQKPNPNAKKMEGERKVKETADYIVFFNKDVNEHRGVLKFNSTDDGAHDETLQDVVDTMEATVKRMK